MSEFNNLTAARFAELERQLSSYQACRVHDVDEKAWLSKQMSAFKTALEFIRDDKIPQGMPASMFADRVLAQSETACGEKEQPK